MSYNADGAVVSRPSHLVALAPLACAIHCIGTPLLIGVVPLLGSPLIERGLLATSLLITATILVTGYRAHRHRGPAVVAGAGAALAVVGLSGNLPPSSPDLVTIAGSLACATALVWSGRLRHAIACSGCGCPAHGEAVSEET